MTPPKVGTHLTLVAIAVLALTRSLPGAQGTDRTARLLADARQALGGDAALSSIHSFTIKGSIERGPGARVVSSHGSFEIACELPDKFVRRETTISPVLLPGADNDSPLAGSTETTVLGFNGDQIVYEPRSPLRRDPGLPQPVSLTRAPVPPQLMLETQHDFILLTLGLFASSFQGAPVRFSDAAGVASSSAVIATGDRVAGALFFDPLTHRPSSFGEYRYDDYRNVNGVMVPFRIAQTRDYSSTASPTRPKESDDITVWQVREFRVNVAIDPKMFKPYVN